jgi:hypothetical protein
VIDGKVKMNGKKELRKEKEYRGNKLRKVEVLVINNVIYMWSMNSLSCGLDHEYTNTYIVQYRPFLFALGKVIVLIT